MAIFNCFSFVYQRVLEVTSAKFWWSGHFGVARFWEFISLESRCSWRKRWWKVVKGGERWWKVVKGGERWWKVVKGGERWWKVVKGGNMAGCQILELLCDMRRVHQPYVDWKKKTLAPWFSKTHPFSPANHASRALLHQPRSDHCWLMIQRCAEPQKCANCGGITLHPWKTGCSFQGFPKWISS